MKIEVGGAQRNCSGETVCGDGYRVLDDDCIITVAVSDGLGHGPQAAAASLAFLDSVERNRGQNDLAAVIRCASKDISSTRGVAGVIVRFELHRGTVSFCGVGNIEMVALSVEAIRPVCMPGIVGRRIRSVRQFDYSVTERDLFAIFTDGVSSRMDFGSYMEGLREQGEETAERVAQVIIEEEGKQHDDATCVVIRLRE